MISILLSLAATVSCIPATNEAQSYSGITLRQISCNPGFSTACGVNGTGRVFCTSITESEKFEWYRLPGYATQVVTAKNQIFSLDSDRKLFYSPTTAKNSVKWSPVPQPKWFPIQQVSFDGQTICVTAAVNKFFCADRDLGTNPNWFQVTTPETDPHLTLFGKLPYSWAVLHAAVYRSEMFVVTEEFRMFYSPYVREPVWTEVPGNAAMLNIHYAGNKVCVLDFNYDVYCSGRTPANSEFLKDPMWKLVDQNSRSISVGNKGQLIGVNTLDQVYAGLV